jgi:hypothetical protein
VMERNIIIVGGFYGSDHACTPPRTVETEPAGNVPEALPGWVGPAAGLSRTGPESWGRRCRGHRVHACPRGR